MYAETGIAPRDTALPGYTPTARALHWVTAVLVVTMIVLGLLMTNIASGPAQNFLFELHKSIGITLIPIVLYRLAYRVGHPPPPLPDDIPFIQKLAAEGLHWTFYALLIVQPLLGWVATSSYPAPISFFWMFNLPQIVAENRALSEQLFAVHRAIGILLGFLIAGHVAAALFHHFVRRDNVLLRMTRG